MTVTETMMLGLFDRLPAEEIAAKVEWGITESDLLQLAVMHKQRKSRRKVIDLLTECNFHKEAAEFKKGIYTAAGVKW